MTSKLRAQHAAAGIRARLEEAGHAGYPAAQAAHAVALSPAKAADRLTYTRRTILADDTTPEQRAEAVALAGALEAALAGACRCSRCGRALRDPVSVARGIGPECLTR